MKQILTNTDFLLLSDFIIKCNEITFKIYFKYELFKPQEEHKLIDTYTVLLENMDFNPPQKIGKKFDIRKIINTLNLFIRKKKLLANVSTYHNQKLEPFFYTWNKKDTIKFFSYLIEVDPMNFQAIIEMNLKKL